VVDMTLTEARDAGAWRFEDGILRSPLLSGLGLIAGFTTRRFGTMGDATTPRDQQHRNRDAVAQHLGFEGVARSRQVHGADVARIDAVPEAPWPEADALWSDRSGLLLGVVAADCVPVLVADPHGLIGVAHAGWRGTSLGIARQLIRAMSAGGGRPDEFVASLGPSIGPCCYNVDGERVALVRSRLGAGYGDVVEGGRFDLWAANERQLREAGVGTVEVAGVCTQCGGEDVWSFRGRAAHSEYGTCLGFLGRPSGAPTVR